MHDTVDETFFFDAQGSHNRFFLHASRVQLDHLRVKNKLTVTGI